MDIPTIQLKIEEIAKKKLVADLEALHKSFLEHPMGEAFKIIKIDPLIKNSCSVQWMFAAHVNGSIFHEVYRLMFPIYVQREIDAILDSVSGANLFDEA